MRPGSAASASRSRTRGWRTATGPIPVITSRSVAQDFGELILDVSWLNQLDDVIFGHGISLLRWRSGGVKYPHDMPPFRFPPSPTLGDSWVGGGEMGKHGASRAR